MGCRQEKHLGKLGGLADGMSEVAPYFPYLLTESFLHWLRNLFVTYRSANYIRRMGQLFPM